MKYYKSKLARFLNGKGFYIVMAICMIAVGFAAYSAMDAARLTDKPQQEENISSSAKSDQENNVTLKPQKQEQPTQNSSKPTATENSSEPVQNQAVAEYFISPLENGTVVKGYDSETLQYSATYNDMRLHTGTDIVPNESLIVKSCGNGTVLSIDADTIMGTVVTVDHGNGIYIRYCGLKNINVGVDDLLSAESVIGEIGTITGECAEEAHLHIEALKDGSLIDPAVLIPFN